MIRNKPRPATVFGIDIGKNVFHVVGLDAAGHPIQKSSFRRETLLQFFERAEPTLVGMEACPGSQWLARKVAAMGHQVRILPAQFVKPYVKSNKSDIIDAAAIAEAVTRGSMRFVEVRSPEQIDIQAMHRVRDRMVAARTALICQMRAFCIEYGIAIHQGPSKFKSQLPRVLADETNDLTAAMRSMLASLFEELKALEDRLSKVNRQIEALAAASEKARRLMTIPGIGPISATALLAAAGEGRQFRRARDMAAWLGLVPREHSTGGRTTLLGISKRGNTYLRRMLVHGARACVLHLDRSKDRLGAWLNELETRMHRNKVTVALAAKIARIAWVVLTKPGATYERRDPAYC
jgi:transposase